MSDPREQIRRDAEQVIRERAELPSIVLSVCHACLALLSELEQSERERQIYFERAQQAERERDEAQAILDNLQKGIT